MFSNERGISSIKRRDFLRTLAGAAAITGIKGPFDFARAAITPGEKGIYITKIYRTKPNPGGIVIRVETNKGITGYGECRDLDSGAQTGLAKYGPIVVGMNPTQVDKVWNAMWAQYSDPTNMANSELNGGSAISAIETACWDITGKVYNVPIWKLLGTKLRDKVPMYADTDGNRSSDVQSRVAKGFLFYKCDMYLSNIAMGNYSNNGGSITITQAGLDKMAAYMEAYRTTLKSFGEPYASAPIASDHYQGYNAGASNQLSVESAIALANVLKEHNGGGWVEDVIDWWTDGCSGNSLKAVCAGTTANIATGEDMVGFTPFQKFADNGSFRIMHPEPNTAGGMHVTLQAAKYAHTKGVKTIFHNSSGPIAMTSYAHIAACVPDFLALEFHQMGSSWHDDLVDGIAKPMINNGYMDVPDGPGLGITPNQTTFSAHGGGTWTVVV